MSFQDLHSTILEQVGRFLDVRQLVVFITLEKHVQNSNNYTLVSYQNAFDKELAASIVVEMEACAILQLSGIEVCRNALLWRCEKAFVDGCLLLVKRGILTRVPWLLHKAYFHFFAALEHEQRLDRLHEVGAWFRHNYDKTYLSTMD